MAGSIFALFLIIVAVIVFLSFFFSFVPVGLWISAGAAGVKVGIMTLVGMRLRRVIPSRIVNPLVKAYKAGLNDLKIDQLEAHYLAGGNVDKVVNALIAAQRANIPLEFERAAAIDLAGRDVLEAVQMCVNPKVIETPLISAMAKDGIELKTKSRLNLQNRPIVSYKAAWIINIKLDKLKNNGKFLLPNYRFAIFVNNLCVLFFAFMNKENA
jgi:uncharacterized protein YqfA (UPF0365 family)